MLTALAPHVATSLRMFIALERERFMSSVATEIVQKLNFGWLLIDARCQIVEAAPHVGAMLERSTLLRRGRYDRLTPASPLADRQLTAVVKRFAEARCGRPQPINLSRDPWLDMVVAPITHPRMSRDARVVAIVYLSGDHASQADRQDKLVELFGLLPSEARLAWAMVRGLSITQSALELGLTVETARSYSKRIYSKTGARGQGELVRLILTSMLALA